MGHGISRIEREIHDDLLDLSGIGFHRAEMIGGSREHFNVFPNQSAQQ